MVQRTKCSKCEGVGFFPDMCGECGACFDPRLLVATAKELPCGHAIKDLIEGESCSECSGSGQLATSSEYNIKDYRAAIRSLWLPIVARKKLNGAEMRFIQELWDRQEPIEIILQAIKAIDERRRLSTLVVHSLGIIRSDVEAIKIKRARMHVGGNRGQRSEVSGQTEAAWRADYAEGLEELAEGVNNPELAAQYRELKRDLPELSFNEVTARFRGIK